jgi:hypothetical protein
VQKAARKQPRSDISNFGFRARYGRKSKAMFRRFWSHADEVGPHWVWNGPVDERGNCVFVLEDGERVPASNIAWEWHQHLWPMCGVRTRVKCRNKRCVRPEHLEAR